MTDLQPVQRRSVPDAVADQLLDRIISGDLSAGGPLPSERDLAEVLGVSRPTVRAALNRLNQAGVVETRQGGGTRVRDYRRHGGLDLLPRLLAGAEGVNVDVLRDVARVRSLIGPQVARMAAEARTAAEGDAGDLHALADAVARAPDAVAQQRAALELWDGIVQRSGSIVFRLLYNGLRAAYEPALEVMVSVMSAEVSQVGTYRALVQAIEDHDGDAAARRAEELLTAGRQAITDVVARLTTGPPDRSPATDA